MSEGRTLLSEPVGVEWNGWRSDTRRLQQRGWQLAVERGCDYDHEPRDIYRLAMKHEGFKLFAISDRTAFQRRHFTQPWATRDFPVFQVVQVLPLDFQLQTFSSVDFRNLDKFEPIDATPQYVRTQTLDDFNIFAVVGKVERICVDKADMSVVEHLEAIKRLQMPVQKELREKERKVNLMAQIVTEAA